MVFSYSNRKQIKMLLVNKIKVTYFKGNPKAT
jgi:hypothetical protein